MGGCVYAVFPPHTFSALNKRVLRCIVWLGVGVLGDACLYLCRIACSRFSVASNHSHAFSALQSQTHLLLRPLRKSRRLWTLLHPPLHQRTTRMRRVMRMKSQQWWSIATRMPRRIHHGLLATTWRKVFFFFNTLFQMESCFKVRF